MKELKIGEEIRIRCMEDGTKSMNCGKCCFAEAGSDFCLNNMLCYKTGRADHKNVHFEIVED